MPGKKKNQRCALMPSSPSVVDSMLSFFLSSMSSILPLRILERFWVLRCAPCGHPRPYPRSPIPNPGEAISNRMADGSYPTVRLGNVLLVAPSRRVLSRVVHGAMEPWGSWHLGRPGIAWELAAATKTVSNERPPWVHAQAGPSSEWVLKSVGVLPARRWWGYSD